MHKRMTSKQMRLARDMTREGCTIEAIQAAIGGAFRPITIVNVVRELEQRHEDTRIARGRKDMDDGRAVVSPDTLREQARRKALNHHDITAHVFGDPLPGCSALDQLRAAQAMEVAP